MSVAEAVQSSSADEILRELYERHGDRIFGFCRNRLRSQQEAEDATQTTFLYAFRALQRGSFPVSEKAWLFKIAENVCFTAYRANGRRSARELANGAELIELAPARDCQPEVLFGLDEALATIPERQRRAFVLRELRGLSHREIAGQIGVSVTAVETLVFRARRNLARALDSGAALKGRVAGLLDLGAVLNLLKSGVGGATAAKVVAAAVLVSVTVLPAGDSAAPQKRAAVFVRAENVQLPVSDAVGGPRRQASPILADASKQSTPSRGRPAAPGDMSSRPGRLDSDEPVVPVAPPSAEHPGLPTTPALPPTPVAPAAATIPALPPVAPVEIPELPVDIPALPILPPPPVQLPDLDELLPPPPQLP